MESMIVDSRKSGNNRQRQDHNLFYNQNELDNRLGHINKYVSEIVRAVSGNKASNQAHDFVLDEMDEHLKDISTTINVLVQYQNFAIDKANQMKKQIWKNQHFNSDYDYPVRVLKRHAQVI